MLRFLSLLLCLFSATSLVALCPETLAKLGVKDYFDTQPIMRRAADAVLSERWGKKNAHIPEFDLDPLKTCDAGNRTFAMFQDKLKVSYSLNEVVPPYRLTPLAGAQGVEILDTPKGKFYFRPAVTAKNPQDAHQKVRRTLAASWINEGLGIDVSAKAKWAKIGDRYGTLSEEVPGVRVENLEQYAKGIEVDRDQLSEVIAFEFLVGNADFQGDNVHVSTDGKLRGFDYDWAFDLGLISLRGRDHQNPSDKGQPNFAGTKLPDFYTKRFIENLKQRDAKWFKRKLEYVLSEEEIESVLFRRDVILQDYKSRFEKP